MSSPYGRRYDVSYNHRRIRPFNTVPMILLSTSKTRSLQFDHRPARHQNRFCGSVISMNDCQHSIVSQTRRWCGFWRSHRPSTAHWIRFQHGCRRILSMSLLLPSRDCVMRRSISIHFHLGRSVRWLIRFLKSLRSIQRIWTLIDRYQISASSRRQSSGLSTAGWRHMLKRTRYSLFISPPTGHFIPRRPL